MGFTTSGLIFLPPPCIGFSHGCWPVGQEWCPATCLSVTVGPCFPRCGPWISSISSEKCTVTESSQTTRIRACLSSTSQGDLWTHQRWGSTAQIEGLSPQKERLASLPRHAEPVQGEAGAPPPAGPPQNCDSDDPWTSIALTFLGREQSPL